MPDRSFGEVNDLLKLRFCMNAHGKDASQAMIGLCNKKLAELLLQSETVFHYPASHNNGSHTLLSLFSEILEYQSLESIALFLVL